MASLKELQDELQRAAKTEKQQMKWIEELRKKLVTTILYGSKKDKLYEIAKELTLKAGYPYTDPRSGEMIMPTTTPKEEPDEELTMPTTSIVTRADLYYKVGSSDKVYHIWVEREGPDYTTKFEYGRRGSTLTKGIKIGPTNQPKALAYFTKTVNEKLAKGYKPFPSTTISGAIAGGFSDPSLGAPMGPKPRARGSMGATGVTGATGPTGPPGVSAFPISVSPGLRTEIGKPKTILTDEPFVPMLLNDTTEEMIRSCMRDKNWCLQEKHDGRRMVLSCKSGGVQAMNKTGKMIEPPQEYWQAIEKHFKDFDFVIDGEACGPIFWVFDLLSLEGVSQIHKQYEDRLDNLGMLMRSVTLQSIICTVGTATTTNGKKALFEEIKARNGEGVVVKNMTAPYTPGRPNSGGPAMKFKFKATATCMVRKVNDKRSVLIAVKDEHAKLIEVGNVTIPADQEIPTPGDLIEVQYLYAYKGGSLFQPVCLGKRDDTEIEQLDKLKFKAETTTGITT